MQLKDQKVNQKINKNCQFYYQLNYLQIALMSLEESTSFQDSKQKRLTKRQLVRGLIKNIMSLYDDIIQKIENGIGMLWQQYFSQELYNLAKTKIQNEIINNQQDLNGWFEQITDSIKEKVNQLSDSLVQHFNGIIDQKIYLKNSNDPDDLNDSDENLDEMNLSSIDKMNLSSIEIRKLYSISFSDEYQKQKITMPSKFNQQENNQQQKQVQWQEFHSIIHDRQNISSRFKNLDNQENPQINVNTLNSLNQNVLRKQGFQCIQDQDQFQFQAGIYGTMLSLLDAFNL